ncbi:hypothetical protein QFC21_002252 [Naganishia friedmannii]|uniref:Uncharacterized protein n=1 Tax=Naganishia friedmannii TaxID=89922 RepID=A0ACC2VXG3_9TREE|nr:hypothetical protein QFC21_002252 [Naganishia friedmannii]
MTSPSSVPITIRPATDNEYIEFGRLHAKAFLPDPLFRLFVSKVDPDVWLQWYFNEQAKEEVHSGFASVIVARRTDTNELVGGAWNQYFTQEHPPSRPPCQFPKGWNEKEDQQMDAPRFKYQQELFKKYGKLTYVHEFAVAVEYQSRGIGRQIMEYIIDEAKQAGMNIALTAAIGKPGFYRKFGFQARGKPIIGTDGKLEGITLMDLELFRATPSLLPQDVSSTSDLIVIRQAREDEYLIAARLHYAVMSPDPEFQLFTSNVDESIWIKWMSDQFKEIVDGGHASLLVAQRTDTGQLVGATLLQKRTRERRPTFFRGQFPEGFNEQELMQISFSGVAFQEEFLIKYGDFIYVAEFVVATGQHGQGIGRRLVDVIIAEANESRMNVALTAVSGKLNLVQQNSSQLITFDAPDSSLPVLISTVVFYEKLGFEVAGKTPMSIDGTVEGHTPMRLVLFEPEDVAQAVRSDSARI